MAIIKFTNSKSNLKTIINYVAREDKTNENLITGKDCIASSSLEEMLAIKKLYNKTDGRQYIHLVQSFSPKDNITPQQVHFQMMKLIIDILREYLMGKAMKYMVYINNSSKGQGLFGLTKDAIVKNVNLGTNNNISGGPTTAGIVAYSYSSKIYNCTNKSNIVSNGSYVGGIVGFAYSDNVIEKCNNLGNITSSSENNTAIAATGGIVGRVGNS